MTRRTERCFDARRWGIAVALAMVAAGCGQDMAIHLRAGDRPPPPAESLPSTSSNALLAGGIAVDRFRIVFRNVRLNSAPTTNGEPTPDQAILMSGAHLIDLSGPSLNPGAMTEILAPEHVAWKSYYELDVDLAPVTQQDVDANPSLAPLLGLTFLIEGTLPGGAPYTYSSALQEVLVRPGVWRNGTNHNNTTINLAPNRWFEGPNGTSLDPTDPAVRATIDANVAASIDAYMDDNVDGLPDSLG
jgi:hypothetical protein